MFARACLPYLLAGCAFTAPLAYAAPAQACGGLFCDGGNPMPVDQNREDILFVRDGLDMEVHIRVLYDGAAENFAWVIPILTEGTPTFEVGSEGLFAALDRSTTPRFVLDNRGGDAACNGGFDVSSGAFVSSDVGAGEDPVVEAQGNFGAFEFALLSGGSVAGITDWLDVNGYAQDPEADDILADYLARGHKFAAIKLDADAGTELIHPIVLRFPGDEPCIPLELTRIAAEADMQIRAYALDEQDMAPLNYRQVVPNLLHLRNFEGSGYAELVTLAVDEAGGRAFVTEYRGPSTIVPSGLIYRSTWKPETFVDAEARDIPQLLALHGLGGQPMLFPILREFLPAPPGYDEVDFWNNLPAYAQVIDADAWDATAFAARMETMIFAPARHAAARVEERPRLTRLFTTISPHEMYTDPVFIYRDDLPEVSREHVATRSSECDERGTWEIESQALCEVAYDTWPEVAKTHDLPYARRIEAMPLVGPPQVSANAEDQIAAAVQAWNQSHCEGGIPPSSETGDGAGPGPAGELDGGAGADALSTRSSCACRSDDAPTPAGLAFLLGLWGWRRRRARAHIHAKAA